MMLHTCSHCQIMSTVYREDEYTHEHFCARCGALLKEHIINITQTELDRLAKRASGGGVGFVARLVGDTVHLRRDEEYAASSTVMLSVDDAVRRLYAVAAELD